MRRVFLFYLLLGLLHVPCVAQNYTGKTLRLWASDSARYNNDLRLLSLMDDSINYAINEGDWKQAMLLQYRQQVIKVEMADWIRSLDRSQIIEHSDRARMSAEAHALAVKNEQMQLENLAREEQQRQMQLHEDSARQQLLHMQMQHAQLQEEMETAEQNRVESQHVHQHEMQGKRIRLLYVSCAIALVLFLLGVYALYRRAVSIRKLKRGNVALKEAYERALALDRMKSLLVQNMSHEIRTPLNAIVGLIEMLSDDSLPLSDEERKEMATLVAQNSEQLTTIMSDIVDMSNLESGLMKMNIAPARANELGRYAVGTVQDNCKEGVRMFFTTEVDDDFVLQTDAARVRQVLINYLTNACRFTDEGEIHVHASLTENKGYLTYSVTDTGQGVPEEKRHLLFKRFEQLDDRKKGNGLGLNICRLIAERLHGVACLDDKHVGKGARFLFLHPLRMLVVVVMLLCGAGTSLNAQNNIYKIDDHLYDEYLRLHDMKSTPQRLLQVGDSLCRVVEASRQYKPLCMYMGLMVSASNAIEDDERVERLCQKIKDIGNRHDLTQYTYWAWYTQVIYAVREEAYDKAMKLTEQMYREATSRDNKYGIIQANKAFGTLYYVKKAYHEAFQFYKQAVEDCERYTPDQDVGTIYANLLVCARSMNMPLPEFEELVDKGLAASKTDVNKMQIGLRKVQCQYLKMDTAAFMASWKDVRQEAVRLHYTDNSLFHLGEAAFFVLKSEYTKALDYCMQNVSDELERNSLLVDIYIKMDEYEKAYPIRKAIYMHADSMRAAATVYELSRMESSLAEHLVRDSLEVARLESARLLEMQSQLNLQELANAQDSVKVRAEHDSLFLVNSQQRMDVLRQQKQDQYQQASMRYEEARLRFITWMVVALGAFFVILIMIFVYIRYVRTSRRLQIIRYGLEASRKQAEEADAKKNQFIQSLSHEVRTPLNAIVGFSDMLASYGAGLSAAEKADLVAQIQKNSSQISAMVNSILALSRLDSGKTVPSFSQQNLYALCQDTLTRASAKARQGVESVLDFRLPPQVSVNTDSSLFMQMLSYLLDNAFKFTQHGQVRVVVDAMGQSEAENEAGTPGSLTIQRYVICVEDTGPGIPQQHADDVFERFYKVDAFTPGTGLGLAVARASAQCIGLQIQLDTSYTEGARFVISPK